LRPDVKSSLAARQLALVLCRAQSLGAAIKLTDMREIADYVWVHPGEERYAATGSTGGALIVARRCSNTARVSLRLSRRAASVMASKGYVTSERSNSRLDVATRRKGCAAKSIVESGHLAAD
jgi:hypothetical protein